MSFTQAELAELAIADAEIETNFVLTDEEIALSRALDIAARHAVMDPKQLRNAESQRAYRAAHKDEIKESQRAYRAAHKDEKKENEGEIVWQYTAIAAAGFTR